MDFQRFAAPPCVLRRRSWTSVGVVRNTSCLLAAFVFVLAGAPVVLPVCFDKDEA